MFSLTVGNHVSYTYKSNQIDWVTKLRSVRDKQARCLMVAWFTRIEKMLPADL
jgi:hypothetical protein